MDAIDRAKTPDTIQLQQVAVKDPVPFGGPSDTTLVIAAGTMELDPVRRVITCTPRNAEKPVIEVPMENVRFYVKLTEKHVAKMQATAQSAAIPKQVKPATAPGVRPKGDTVKFVRGPDGKPVEQIV